MSSSTSSEEDVEYAQRLRTIQDLVEGSDVEFDNDDDLQDYNIDLSSLPQHLASSQPTFQLGDVSSLTDKLMLVTSAEYPSVIAEIDSLVVTEDRNVVGKIVDILGPVTSPIYLVCAKAEFIQTAELGETLFFSGKYTTLKEIEAQASKLDEQELETSDDE